MFALAISDQPSGFSQRHTAAGKRRSSDPEGGPKGLIQLIADTS